MVTLTVHNIVHPQFCLTARVYPVRANHVAISLIHDAFGSLNKEGIDQIKRVGSTT